MSHQVGVSGIHQFSYRFNLGAIAQIDTIQQKFQGAPRLVATLQVFSNLSVRQGFKESPE